MRATRRRRPPSDRLPAIDAAFLLAESERTPMHVGSLSRLEPDGFFGPDGTFLLDEVRAHVAGRLHLLPRFRKRISAPRFGAGRPVWVDDESFCIDRHVRALELPPPGTERELAVRCCELQMVTLDRDHPLWELWFVHGLADGTVALIEKIHHSLVDGVAAVDVAAALLDTSRVVPSVEAPHWSAEPPPPGVVRWLRTPLDRAADSFGALDHIARVVASPSSLGRSAAGLADALAPQLGILGSPRRLSRRVGTGRTLRWVTVPLEGLRRRDVTVNDVAMTAAAGATSVLLERHGVDLDHYTMQVLVPVSTRTEDEHGQLGNRLSAFLVPLPARRQPAASRLPEVAAAMRSHKSRHQPDGVDLALEGLDLLGGCTLRLAARAVHRQRFVDLILTNVPGPAFPLYFRGARLLESVPIVPLGGNLPIEVAVLSSAGQLTFGVYADAASDDDALRFVEALRAELEELADRRVR